MKNKKIRAVFVFEIMGRPAEHVVASMNQFLDQIASVKGMELVGRKVHEPKPVENSELFTTFAELEVVAETMDHLFLIMFNLFPSHVEIIEPDELTLNNFELTSLMSELALKLHKYESVAKVLSTERDILFNRLKEVDPEFIKKVQMQNTENEVKEEKKTPEKASKKKKI